MIDDIHHELLSAYLDGEVTDEERQRVEKLLAENAECRQVYEELRALRGSLAALPRHKLDEDISARVLRMAEQSMLGHARMPGDATARREGDKLVDVTAREGANTERVSADRRSRAWRAIVYPVLAVAAAVAMIVNSPNEKAKREPQIASAPVKQAPQAALSAPPGEPAAAEPFAVVEGESRDDADGANPLAPPAKIAGKKLAGSAGKLDIDDKKADFRANGGSPAFRPNSAAIPSAPPALVAGEGHRKVGSASSDATLVVTCKLAPLAVRDKAFDALLVRNHLTPWTAPELATKRSSKKDDKSAALARARASVEPLKREADLAAKTTEDEALDGKDSSWSKSVVVELDAGQLVAVLADLQNHPEHFVSVELPAQRAEEPELDSDAAAADSIAPQNSNAPAAGAAQQAAGQSSGKRLVVLFRLSAAAEN